MIKFTASGDGMVLLGLGLEPENIERMKKGQPIRVKLSDLGFTGPIAALNIMIFTGKGRDEMIRAVSPFISKDTVIRDE